jgi:hypothetical protein
MKEHGQSGFRIHAPDNASNRNVAKHNKHILAIVVHQCDKLRTDVNIYHPLVHVHMVDLGRLVAMFKKSNKCVIQLHNRHSL